MSNLNGHQFQGLDLDYDSRRATLGGKPVAVHRASWNTGSEPGVWGADIPLENGHIASVNQFANHTEHPFIHMALTDDHDEEGEYHHEGKPVAAMGVTSGEEAHAHLQRWSQLPAPRLEVLQANREKLSLGPQWTKWSSRGDHV